MTGCILVFKFTFNQISVLGGEVSKSRKGGMSIAAIEKLNQSKLCTGPVEFTNENAPSTVGVKTAEPEL